MKVIVEVSSPSRAVVNIEDDDAEGQQLLVSWVRETPDTRVARLSLLNADGDVLEGGEWHRL